MKTKLPHLLLAMLFVAITSVFSQSIKPHVEETADLKDRLSEKMLAPQSLQTTLRSTNAQTALESLSLGDGMYLWSSDDQTSSVLEVKVNASQWGSLKSYNTFSGILNSITQNIYSKCNDDFDFIFFVLNTPQDQSIINSLGIYGVNVSISNNIQGIGRSQYSNSEYYGSDGKLKSMMYFPYAEAILLGPALHELAHNWAAFIVDTYAPDNTSLNGHWGISNADGQLGGFKYVRVVQENCDGIPGKTLYQASRNPETNPDGSFKYPGFGDYANGGNSLPYSDIELYLMGMKSAQELRNSGFRLDIYSGNDYNSETFGDGYFYSTTKTSYTIDDIIAKCGARIPDASVSQKQFKVLTVALSLDNTTQSYVSDIMQAVDWIAGSANDTSYYPWLYNFRQATNNVGSLVTNDIKNSFNKTPPEINTIVTMTTTKTADQTVSIDAHWSGTGSIMANETPLNKGQTFVNVPANGKIELIAIGKVSLTSLVCIDNQLTELDVSNNAALTTLECYNNQLTHLDISNNTALTYLNCYNNQLTSLDVSNNTALTLLICSNNQLTALDASNNTALTYLSCHNNQLTNLNISNNTALTGLECDNNQLTELDVRNSVALTELFCYNNQLTSLDVRSSTELTSLYCHNNQLTELNVRNNIALTNLYCYNNQLTELDIRNSTALTYLYCYNNQLTSLVSNNTALTLLSCSDNQLTELDVKNNTALTELYCYNNQLTSLDVRNNTALTSLYCYNNQLTSLDVSSHTALTELECSRNQLTSLNLSGCNVLEYVHPYYQQITVPVVAGATSFSNPIYYHNQTGVEKVVINGVAYAQGEEVPIPAGATELAFTSTTIGNGNPFNGTITINKNTTAIPFAEAAPIKVYSTEGNIIVENAPVGETIHIYNVSGILVTETMETSIAMPQGIYIVKVGKDTFKVTCDK